MKHQDLIKYHQSDITDIRTEIGKLEITLVESRLKLKQGQLKNVHQIKNLRLSIAQLQTIAWQKELAAKLSPPAKPAKPLIKKVASKKAAKPAKE
jgi:ribosomal protein L29